MSVSLIGLFKGLEKDYLNYWKKYSTTENVYPWGEKKIIINKWLSYFINNIYALVFSFFLGTLIIIKWKNR